MIPEKIGFIGLGHIGGSDCKDGASHLSGYSDRRL